MNNLYKLKEELIGKKNYVYTTGNRAKAFVEAHQLVDGFIVRLGKEQNRRELLLDKPVITLEEAASMEVNVLIVHTVWHTLYDEVRSLIEMNHIFFNSDSYTESKEECQICGEKTVLSGRASFVPFLQERMFDNNPPDTNVMFCCNCGSAYSSYRPTDKEICLLYDGYRNEKYVNQRQKYEPEYTEEFNRNLFEGKCCVERKQGLADFLNDIIDFKSIGTVLDFGGDKGQFIPDELRKANCYVYDISGAEVLEGIRLLRNPSELDGYKWDFIMCCHVMEHLPDVKGYLEMLLSYMGENTYLYIEVPYERLTNMDYAQIHEHINMFGRSAFFRLAEIYSLEVIKFEVNVSVRCLMKLC